MCSSVLLEIQFYKMFPWKLPPQSVEPFGNIFWRKPRLLLIHTTVNILLRLFLDRRTKWIMEKASLLRKNSWKHTLFSFQANINTATNSMVIEESSTSTSSSSTNTSVHTQSQSAQSQQFPLISSSSSTQCATELFIESCSNSLNKHAGVHDWSRGFHLFPNFATVSLSVVVRLL